MGKNGPFPHPFQTALLSVAFEEEQEEQVARRSGLLREQRLGMASAQGVSWGRWKYFLTFLQNVNYFPGDKSF